VIKVMRINKDMRHETKEKRRLNKMDQWWLGLGTASSGLELAGEADSPAKVYILYLIV
jgi:hypothetical protein